MLQSAAVDAHTRERKVEPGPEHADVMGIPAAVIDKRKHQDEETENNRVDEKLDQKEHGPRGGQRPYNEIGAGFRELFFV